MYVPFLCAALYMNILSYVFLGQTFLFRLYAVHVLCTKEEGKSIVIFLLIFRFSFSGSGFSLYFSPGVLLDLAGGSPLQPHYPLTF